MCERSHWFQGHAFQQAFSSGKYRVEMLRCSDSIVFNHPTCHISEILKVWKYFFKFSENHWNSVPLCSLDVDAKLANHNHPLKSERLGVAQNNLSYFPNSWRGSFVPNFKKIQVGGCRFTLFLGILRWNDPDEIIYRTIHHFYHKSWC